MRLVKRMVRWFLAVAIVVFIVSGIGITEFRTVEALTFGLVPKVLSFEVHTHPGLALSLLVLLILHTYLAFFRPIRPKNGKRL